MTLLLMIPVAGLLVLPLGVTAATMLYCEIEMRDGGWGMRDEQ